MGKELDAFYLGCTCENIAEYIIFSKDDRAVIL